MAKKKKEYEPRKLCDDCKACMRERNINMPLVSDMVNADAVTLVRLKGSLVYLREMTNVMEHWSLEMCDKFGDKKYSEMLADYFTDIRNLISVYIKMKELGESPTSTGQQ